MKSEETPRQKAGSYRSPYQKADGTKMVKWSLHMPLDFVSRFKLFMAHQGPGIAANEFVEQAVDEKMRREVARQKRQGLWKGYEDLLDEEP